MENLGFPCIQNVSWVKNTAKIEVIGKNKTKQKDCKHVLRYIDIFTFQYFVTYLRNVLTRFRKEDVSYTSITLTKPWW